MRLHFQVVFLDKSGYILGFENFTWRNIANMVETIENRCTSGDIQKIEITRWNEKGERE